MKACQEAETIAFVYPLARRNTPRQRASGCCIWLRRTPTVRRTSNSTAKPANRCSTGCLLSIILRME